MSSDVIPDRKCNVSRWVSEVGAPPAYHCLVAAAFFLACTIFHGEAKADAKVSFAAGHDMLQAGDHRAAVELFREGLRAQPNNGLAHYFLAEALLKQAPPDPKGAIQHLLRAIELLPESRERLMAIHEALKLISEVSRAGNMGSSR